MVLHAVHSSDLKHATTQVGNRWEFLFRKRLFITGGTGFVGKWLLETLLHANRVLSLRCEVTVLSRDPGEFTKLCPHLALEAGVRFIRGDVKNFEFSDASFDMIIHGAIDVANNPTPLEVLETSIKGTQRVLEFAAHSGVKNFLLLSSGATYGCQPPELYAIPETWYGAPDPLAPDAAYGTGKRTAECLAIQFGKVNGIAVKIARCFSFVGPYLPMNKHFAIGNFIRDALQAQTIVIHGDGTPMRSYLYAADLAAWLWTILLQGKDGVAYNVGGDEVVSIVELANTVNAALHTRVEVVRMKAATAHSLPERYIPDLTKSSTELGLSARINLREAIVRTAQWVRDEGGL